MHSGSHQNSHSFLWMVPVGMFKLSCLCRFPVDEIGTMKSVTEYFKETYGYVIRHPFLPCLQVGNDQRPNYLPMEVCKIVEGQRYSKRLNERQITALLRVTCQRPRERENDILQTVNHNAYHEDPYAQEFGIHISAQLAQVEARILPAPRVSLFSLHACLSDEYLFARSNLLSLILTASWVPFVAQVS
jgi:hypothetical protein